MYKLVSQNIITDFGEAIRELDKKYFKLWMAKNHPEVNQNALDDFYGYIFLAFWDGVNYANQLNGKY